MNKMNKKAPLAQLTYRQRRRQQLAAGLRRLREAWQIFVQNRIALTGLAILIIFAIAALIYPILRNTLWQGQRYNPLVGFDINSAPHPSPPSWIPPQQLAAGDVHRFDRNRPSFDHLLGTDTLGRDVLSILLASTYHSLIVGLAAALTTAVVGITLAALSAYYRGRVDAFFAHISDAFMLLPAPLFMIAIGAFLRTQRTTFLGLLYRAVSGSEPGEALELVLQPLEFGIIYGVMAGAGGATIVLRSHALKVMNMSFIEAARVAGSDARHTILHHLVPHLIPLAAVYMMVIVTGAVVADGFLAFFGFNINPLNWGTMIYNAITYRIINAVVPWYALLAPAIAISLFTAAFYMVSRGLHQVVEPRLRSDYVKS